MLRHRLHVLVGLCLVLRCLVQDVGASTTNPPPHQTFRYGEKGLEFETEDGNTFLWLGFRLQLRYTDQEDEADDPPNSSTFSLNRGRIKGGGHVARPWIQIYSEYDFSNDTLLDYRVTLQPREALGMRAGQWKTEYNRERVDSSGKQQFVDRSIANYWFTLDRQAALQFRGRAAASTPYDSNYWLTWISGNRRGGGVSDADGLAVVRLQWNALGQEAAFSQSDLKRREEPMLGFALGAVQGRSRYTRFSSDGGGSLPGYEEGQDGQYDIRQLMQDSIFHYRGFSWQQELHGKVIDDRGTGDVRRLLGGYAQAGYFAHQCWDWVPEPLELAFRIGLVDPNTTAPSDRQEELTLAANWFFNGHRNKLTADVSHIDTETIEGDESVRRFRMQWDVSF